MAKRRSRALDRLVLLCPPKTESGDIVATKGTFYDTMFRALRFNRELRRGQMTLSITVRRPPKERGARRPARQRRARPR